MIKLTLVAGAIAALVAIGTSGPASAQQLCSSPLGDVVCSAGIGGGLGSAFGGQKGAQWGAGIGAGLSILNQAGQPRYAPQPTYVAPQPTYVAPQPTYVAPQPTYVAPAPTYVAADCQPRMVGGAYCNVPACWKACGGSFQSFQLYDCSYQPSYGPRQRCYK